MVICLERDADLHMVQLMLLPVTVSCFSKIQVGFTFLVAAHLGSPGQRAVKQVCVGVCDEATLQSAVRSTRCGLLCGPVAAYCRLCVRCVCICSLVRA